LISTLFSLVGLAALGSYVLINIFLGYRFHVRYKKLLEKRTVRLLDSFKNELVAFWDEKLARIINDLAKFDKEVGINISAISGLKVGN